MKEREAKLEVPPGFDLPEQIGRASCRERVCSVV